MLPSPFSPSFVWRGTSCLLGFALLASPAAAQAQKVEKRASVDVSAITGPSAGGKHCISGLSSNVHGLGWIEAGSTVTIAFESDFDPIAGVAILGLDVPNGRGSYIIDDDSGGNLEPEIRYTASISGNAALYVSGYQSSSGCYWYKPEVVRPTRSTIETVSSDPPRPPIVQPTSISGLPSVSYQCVAGQYVANIHSIGRVSQGGRVTITFETDFDAIAGIATLDLSAASPQPRFAVDDDSGGRGQPELRVTLSEGGTVALFVSAARGAAGCYRYKVEIQ